MEMNGTICFNYDQEWLGSPDSFPISHSLPLSGEFEHGIADHRFFANLLPEAAAREVICRSLGLSVDNDFELLAAIGGECAGALEIIPEGSQLPTAACSYEPIRIQDLQKAIETNLPYTRIYTGGKLRLSLAGAQNKWPVYFDGKQLYWPVDNAPSSHILKFTHRDYKGLHWNEAYTSYIFRQFGLPAGEVKIGDGYSLIKRYDRKINADGTILRLHQEDFCQCLGYPHYKKYESDGGPGFKDCIDLVRKISASSGKDQINLLYWQELNLLLGNADGHAKNLSILYSDSGPELAPFYDLVCTAVYPGISRNLAFSVGGNADPSQMRKQDWHLLASKLEMRPRILLNALDNFITILQEHLPDYHQQFIDLNGSDPILDRIDQTIRRQLRRTRALLNE